MVKLPTLFFLSTLSVGGSEKKTIRIVNTLRRRGHDVHLAYLNRPETLLADIDPEVPLVCLDRRGKFFVGRGAAARRLCSRQPDC